MANSQGYVGDRDRGEGTVVVVFLRGGADGLNMVAPVEDAGYHRARPQLGVSAKEAVRLDDLFGLHPLLRPLEKVYSAGELAMVHCVGSEDSTRSHFEAQDLMEHGGVAGGGWLGRFLRYRSSGGSGALSAIAMGTVLPECLRGAPAAAVIQSLDDFSLGADTGELVRALRGAYGEAGGALGAAGRDTLAAVDRLDRIRKRPYRPADGVTYSGDSFGRGMGQVAQLIKGDVGLEAVSVDLGGWDSHFVQGQVMDSRMVRLAETLWAFWADLGDRMAETTVVVMTEFGRRVHENASFGTDHGRGSVMFVMGGGVAGGRVLADWVGLDDADLEGPGDLPVRHNYRDVLAPMLTRHGAGASLGEVFPSYALQPMGLYG